MSLEFLFKIIIAFCLNYFLSSRFLYAYEIKGDCSVPLTIDMEKVIRNKFCKIIFPREFKNYQESLDGIGRISIIGLLHCIIFYFFVQITYIASIIIFYVNEQVADKISMISFKVMLLGYAVFIVSMILIFIIDYVKKNLFQNK